MHRWLSIPLLLAIFEAQAFSFPEMPFCPFGGPPGWYNVSDHPETSVTIGTA